MAAVRIVAIGASAGGLDAFIDLVSAIPPESGLALVLVQHLDPRSLLVDLLAGATKIPVQEVVDGMGLDGNRIYLIPPDAEMTVQGNGLRLVPRTSTVPPRPLDRFFSALAAERGSGAIGVVLSGNDPDGASGLQAIRDAGGITFAQTAESAEFAVMPRAAAVAADFVLPPAGIAARLAGIARGEGREEGRRDLAGDHPTGVAAFFREPERFEALKTAVFPAMVKDAGAEDGVRIWVAGCSTGEEVYSLAITLLEYLDGRPDVPPISIYGTDIDEQSLVKARTAFYPREAMGGVSAERLARFFTPAAGGYRIAQPLRELCIFAAHDLTRDPPYSRVNLVTCCNVELQKKAVSLLQYALAPGGFLVLASSESLRGVAGELTRISGKPLIYRKPPLARRTGSVARDEDEAFLAAHFASCGVLINERMEITRIRGEIAPFIALEPGEASLNLFGLIRHHQVLAVLRPAVRRALREQAAITGKDILVMDGDLRRRVAFDVIPYGAAAPGGDRCWIVFHSMPGPATGKPRSDSARTEMDGLRQALAAAMDDREQLADDASAAAEEARSSDEELRHSNQELSTLNDELRLRNTALVRMNDDIENLLGAVEIPILFVGRDLTMRRFNVTAGSLLNLGAQAIGRPLGEATSTIDIAQLEKLVGAVMETSQGADVEVQDAAGDWRLLRIRAYRKSGGEIDGAIVAILNINASKLGLLVAEEATRAATMLAQASRLLASSLDYETTLESLARLSTAAFADWCAVDLVNEDGTIRHLTVSHANPVLRELAAQFQQVAFSEPENAPGAPQALRLRKSVLLTDIAESQLTGVRPEAKITQLIGALGVRSLISVPLMVRDRVLGTTTFCSSRRQYDASDLHLAEELSQRAAVAIDTAMLFREAESANRYKDAFLGTVAHELRTPLTSIIGWVQLAKSSPEIYSEALARVDESASVLRIFIEDLLDVTRIREQKLSMEMAQTDLAAVVTSALEMTTLSAGGQVRLHLTLDPAPVMGDRVRLLQVVWNLLSNAIKFTPAGGEVDVWLERDGNDARLSVMDTGVGISADFAPHVFELYRQADDKTRPLPGLGIGLAIVAQIVRVHGGAVRVESPGLGRGATFIVTIPLLADAPGASRQGRRTGRLRRGDDPMTAVTAQPEEPS
ncbi:MAG TPA: chemotaxis protein CheB [Thermoanaerobaculia bacterium]|nr:chemotaxis protein CheB [Thermoanaerobaculia bacterium]